MRTLTVIFLLALLGYAVGPAYQGLKELERVGAERWNARNARRIARLENAGFSNILENANTFYADKNNSTFRIEFVGEDVTQITDVTRK